MVQLFTGESIEVSNASGHTIDIDAGGYYVYTDQQLVRPMVNLIFKVKWSETGNSISGAIIELTDNGSRITGSNGEAAFIPLSNSSFSYKVSVTGQDDVTGTVAVDEDDKVVTVTVEGADYIDENEETNIAIYPNPANNQISIEVDADYTLTITDLNGRQLSKTELITGSQSVDLSGLNKGVYILRFENEYNYYYRKIIKK